MPVSTSGILVAPQIFAPGAADANAARRAVGNQCGAREGRRLKGGVLKGGELKCGELKCGAAEARIAFLRHAAACHISPRFFLELAPSWRGL